MIFPDIIYEISLYIPLEIFKYLYMFYFRWYFTVILFKIFLFILNIIERFIIFYIFARCGLIMLLRIFVKLN
jgi:hypothetical protein